MTDTLHFRLRLTSLPFLLATERRGEKAEEAEVEETLKRIEAHKGVIGTIVVNAEGIPIRTTLDNSTTVQYAGLLRHLTMKARSTVRDIDPQNDLTFLRIRSKKHEILVAPENDFLLIVIQNPCE
ncbi:dynein light chain roadblock-type 2 [Enoplosus armatus]|uniref:dynein light chain roadblock-type 2 n=1 Tax=Enoplosus armatus TaxID=215367 RepID=UPI003995331D